MNVYDIWLSMALGSRVTNAKAIIDLALSPKELYENRKSLNQYSFFTRKQLESVLITTLEQARDVEKLHILNGIEAISYMDNEYPEAFRRIFDGPLVLFFKGDIHMLNNKYLIAMIGARNPDRDGFNICNNIASILAQNDVTIVSGLAQGLDSKAHMAALEQKGKTIAFIGTALDKSYPAANRALQEKIAKYGCVISEYYVGASTPPKTFLERNRLIAAISIAVCVIQAKSRSGTLATARNAVEYNRHVFAVPGTVINEIYDGTNKLIKEGAEILLEANDILEFLGISKTTITASKANKAKLELSDQEKAVYKAIGRGTKSANEIFAITQIPIHEIKAAIANMEINGFLTAQSPGVYFIK